MPADSDNGTAQPVRVRYLGSAFNIAYGHYAAAKDFSEVSPLQMLHQVVVVKRRIIKAAAFCGHQQCGLAVVSPEEILTAFFQRKQAVNGGSELTAHVPVIERGCQYDYIAVLHRRINTVHVIPLHAGAILTAAAAKAALAAVNIHIAQKELGYGMANAFRALSKSL